MPLDNLEGVHKLSEDDLATLKGDPAKIDDATLKAMALKSGDTVEHMKEVLGLYGDKGDKGGDAGDDKLLAGKYKTEADLDSGIQSLIDKYGKEEAYKMLEGKMGKADVNADKGDNAANKGDALSTDGDAKAATEKAAANLVAAQKIANDLGATGDLDAIRKATADVVVAEKVVADLAGTAAGDQKIDMHKYFDEYSENDQLSIESYKELKEAGYDQDLVDAYIQGQIARVELFTNKVHEMAGGEEQFGAMVDWGSVNLDEAQIIKFNDGVKSGDLSQAQDVMEALKTRYEKAEGTFKRGKIEPTDSVTGAGAEGYASAAEMSAAMRDPRYKTDAAYVAMVQKKMAVSKF